MTRARRTRDQSRRSGRHRLGESTSALARHAPPHDVLTRAPPIRHSVTYWVGVLPWRLSADQRSRSTGLELTGTDAASSRRPRTDHAQRRGVSMSFASTIEQWPRDATASSPDRTAAAPNASTRSWAPLPTARRNWRVSEGGITPYPPHRSNGDESRHFSTPAARVDNRDRDRQAAARVDPLLGHPGFDRNAGAVDRALRRQHVVRGGALRSRHVHRARLWHRGRPLGSHLVESAQGNRRQVRYCSATPTGTTSKACRSSPRSTALDNGMSTGRGA